MDIIYRTLSIFPAILYSEYYERLFTTLNLPTSSSRYLTGVVFIAIILIFLSVINKYILILSIGVLILGMLYPIYQYNQTIKTIRSELPKFILDIGSGMLIGLNLVDAMRLALKDNPNIERYFRHYMQRIETGRESVQDVLVSFSNRFRDEQISIIMFQLINSISSGSAKELKHLGMQLLRDQMISLKEFGKRLQIISQFYIVILLILPIYVFLVASMARATEQEIPDIDDFIILTFPTILLSMIYLIHYIFPSNYIFQSRVDTTPFLLNLGVMLIAYYTKLDVIHLIILYTILSVAFVYLKHNKIYEFYRVAKIEEKLLDVSLILSSLPIFSLREFFQRVIKANIQEWKTIAKNSISIIDSGISVKEVFNNIYKIPSNYVKVFATNLEYIYHSGVSSSERVIEWIDSFINMLNIRKEMEAEFSTFKYTIIISFLLVPLIYSYLYDFSKKMLEAEFRELLYLPILIVGSGVSLISVMISRKDIVYLYLFVFSILGLILVQL
ncbi:MAG: hypothetical protein N3C61_00820 [Candidatus Micrarchaeota archaeon]|nr:hypothetical protein [Candidatus Micrarchaeota archaeon]